MITRLRSDKGSFIRSPLRAFDSDEAPPVGNVHSFVFTDFVAVTQVFACPGQFEPDDPFARRVRPIPGGTAIEKGSMTPAIPDVGGVYPQITKVVSITAPGGHLLDTQNIVIRTSGFGPSCYTEEPSSYWWDIADTGLSPAGDPATNYWYAEGYIANALAEAGDWTTGTYTFVLEYQPY